MGSIYKRGNKYWIKYYRNGKPYRESTGSTKESDAKRLLKLREGEIAQGKTPGVLFDKVTFAELSEGYILDYRINGKKTLRKAEKIVENHLEPFFGQYKAPRITTDLVKQYIAKRLADDAKNATINRELSALKRMFNLARQCTPPKVAQVPYIPMLKERNVRKGFFEKKEFETLRDALPDHLKPMVTFAYKTGCRLGEITELTWDQVDLKQAVVTLEVGTTKNDEGRSIPLDEELLATLKGQFRNRQLGCPYVFHRKGEAIVDFRGSWKNACKEAKCEGRLFHDLRRTAVRNMIRAGVPERVAMSISGHKTRSVFDRYNIVSVDDLKEAVEKTHAYLNPQTSTGTI